MKSVGRYESSISYKDNLARLFFFRFVWTILFLTFGFPLVANLAKRHLTANMFNTLMMSNIYPRPVQENLNCVVEKKYQICITHMKNDQIIIIN